MPDRQDRAALPYNWPFLHCTNWRKSFYIPYEEVEYIQAEGNEVVVVTERAMYYCAKVKLVYNWERNSALFPASQEGS